MPETVLFEEERRSSRAEIADYLRAVAEKLEAGESITFSGAGDSVTVEPPARPTFELKVEREAPPDAERGELSVELELEWDERETESAESLSIE